MFDLDPTESSLSEVFNNLAIVSEQLKSYDEAIVYYNKALNILT